MSSKKTQVENKFVSVFDVYKKVKRSGGFRRKVKNRKNALVREVKKNTNVINQCPLQQQFQQDVEEDCSVFTSNTWLDVDISDDEFTDNQPFEQISNVSVPDMQIAFKSGLSKWAIESNIPHYQLRTLISMCNETLPFRLPFRRFYFVNVIIKALKNHYRTVIFKMLL